MKIISQHVNVKWISHLQLVMSIPILLNNFLRLFIDNFTLMIRKVYIGFCFILMTCFLRQSLNLSNVPILGRSLIEKEKLNCKWLSQMMSKFVFLFGSLPGTRKMHTGCMHSLGTLQPPCHFCAVVESLEDRSLLSSISFLFLLRVSNPGLALPSCLCRQFMAN